MRQGKIVPLHGPRGLREAIEADRANRGEPDPAVSAPAVGDDDARSRAVRWCEWLGGLSGLLGSLLLATHSAWSGYGFVAFAASNAFLLAFAVRVRAWGLFTMQIGFCVTTALGLARWFT